MKAIHFNTLAIVLLLGLASFRPWKAINRVCGLRDLSAQIDTLVAQGDTMTLQSGLGPQPVQLVVAPAQIDSLAGVVAAKKDSVQTLADEEKELDKKLAAHRKTNRKKQAQLVSEEQIKDILAKQTEQAKTKPAKDFDPDEESELEKDVNKTPRPGMARPGEARLGSGSPAGLPPK